MAKTQMTTAQMVAEFQKRLPGVLKVDPVVTVELKAGTYQLEYDNRALKNIFTDTGINLLEEDFKSSVLQDPTMLGIFFFRALQRHHPDMTQEEADGLLSLRLYLPIRRKLLDCLDAIVPDMDDIEVPAPTGELATKKEADKLDPR